MGKINWGRVVLGGLLAGLVLNVIDYLVYGVWLAADLNAAMQALGKSAMAMSTIVWFIIFDFLFGIFLVWFYAAIRPRFGPGPRTAALAGVAIWVLYGALHTLGEAPMGLFPPRIYVIGLIVGLAEYVAAGVIGAKYYVEA
jgi:hypothetical protein